MCLIPVSLQVWNSVEVPATNGENLRVYTGGYRDGDQDFIVSWKSSCIDRMGKVSWVQLRMLVLAGGVVKIQGSQQMFVGYILSKVFWDAV